MSEASALFDRLDTTVDGSMTDNVVAHVSAAVADGRMQPGVLYSVYQLAEQLGVSRSPVREALLRLSEAGMVRFERNRGFRVVLPTPHDIAEIFAIRLSLELPAVRTVASKANEKIIADLRRTQGEMDVCAAVGDERQFAHYDRKLHDTIMMFAGNERARAIVTGLRVTTTVLGASTARRSRSLTDINDQHRPIIDAISRRDAVGASRLLDRHITDTGTLLVAQAIEDQNFSADARSVWTDVVAEIR